MSKHLVSGIQPDRLPAAIAEIMDNLDDLIWSLRLPDLIPIYFNQTATQVYGASCQGLLEDPWCWLEGVAAADRGKVRDAIAKAQVHNSCLVNYHVVTDGCVHYYSARLKVFRDTDGCPMRLDAIATLFGEIGDPHKLESFDSKFRHKETEAIFLQGESRYSDLVEQQRDLILRSLPDTTITFANDALCDILNCELEEIIGRKWIDFADLNALGDLLDSVVALSLQNSSFIVVNRDLRPNGQSGWLQWIKQGVFDQQGQLIEIQSVGRDITALKQSELALKQLNQELEQRIEQRTGELKLSEERNSAILHALPDLLLLLKPDGTCVQCITPSITNQNLFIPIKHHISEVLSPETLESQLKLYAKAIATGESQTYEHKVIKFGKPFYEEVRISPYRDDELLVIVRDITARKQAEERLVKSDAHLKTAQRIGKLGSWEYDIQTDKATWSEEVFRIFGRDPVMSEPSYLELKNYIHPEDFAYFDQTVKNAVQNCLPYDVDYRICHGDGTLTYVSVKAEIICDATGQPVQIVGTVLDISDRKLAELELLRSRDLRESLFNESTDALFLVDPQTLLTTDCNLPAVALFEAEDKSHLIGIEGHILQRYQFSPEELQEIVIDVNKYGFWSREVEYITLKGKHFWGNLAVKVIEIAGKSINLVRVTDISDRKRFETQILKTSQQLESTNHELESFCYSVSHDLRAPLRHINGFVNALRQQINQQNSIGDPKIIHYLEIIDQSSQKMGQLIDGLLSLSRYGRRPLEFQQLKVRDLVDAALEIISADPSFNTNVQFEIDELPELVGDPTLLEQVFRNLISNAIKFSRNHPQPCVSITSLPDRTVIIKDNGVGFQMEYADKLFGAFQRLHNERDFEGTGIGLAIVQRIVQRHHGKVWAESQPNQGAAFFIQI